MVNPMVSIVIPVYNGANYLAEAIDSALAQTYPYIEIIVVNDGSTDNGATEAIALSYGNRIRYYKKENGGVSSALNMGIACMEGDYFSWLSHDDLYVPTKVEKQVKLLETDKDIVLCSGSLVDGEKKKIFHHTKTLNKSMTGRELFHEFLHGYTLNGLGFLIPRRVFEQVGRFDESMRYLQDLDLWLRMMWYDFRFICQKDLLVVSRVHRMQTTNLKSDLFDVDRGKLAQKHLTQIKSVMSEADVRYFLRLYYFLFLKGNNQSGLALLNEYENISFKQKIQALPYRIKRLVKDTERVIYNFILQQKGDRDNK